MKRVLFVCAGQSFPTGAFALLQSMYEREPVSITGLFFCPIDYDAENCASHVPISAPFLRLQERERQQLNANKTLFMNGCAQWDLPYAVHENEDQWDKDLFGRETRFADLVVLSGELFYEYVDSVEPNFFLREALRASECPVLIVPQTYTTPQSLVIAYDGSRECLFAIKQFCYLFPWYTQLPVEIVYVKKDNAADIPEMERLEEFAHLHFGSLNVSCLEVEGTGLFTSWVKEKQQALMVAGSFGRSRLSYIARKSFARQVVCDHQIPVFIAHA